MNLRNILGAIILIGILFGGGFLYTYNSLVNAEEAVDAQWSQVENQYQRRADLIPNLVDTVKASSAQEEKILLEVTKYLNQWNMSITREEKIEAAKGMDSAISMLLQSFPTLQAQLEGTENRIAVERMRYNEKVRDYNARIKRMPSSLVADMYGFKAKLYFEAERGAEEAPEVKFGTPTATPAATPTITKIPSASVELYGEKTDVDLGEDIVLKLSAVNLITKPVMNVQVILIPPSGMSVTSSEFATSTAGQANSKFEVQPGDQRSIIVTMQTTQIGDFTVKGRIVYYFGDNTSTAEDHTLELPIKVRPAKIINR